jgi:ABC-type cobalt transport system substrate-binding protein
VGEPNFRDELEKVWVPKDVGELEGLLLTIQNESGKKILKHKIQQILKERRHNNREKWDESWDNWPKNWHDDGWRDEWH